MLFKQQSIPGGRTRPVFLTNCWWWSIVLGGSSTTLISHSPYFTWGSAFLGPNGKSLSWPTWKSIWLCVDGGEIKTNSTSRGRKKKVLRLLGSFKWFKFLFWMDILLKWWLIFSFFCVCVVRRWKNETDVTCSTRNSWIASNVFYGGSLSSCRSNLTCPAKWISGGPTRCQSAPPLLQFRRHPHWLLPSPPKPVLLPSTVIKSLFFYYLFILVF